MHWLKSEYHNFDTAAVLRSTLQNSLKVMTLTTEDNLDKLEEEIEEIKK